MTHEWRVINTLYIDGKQHPVYGCKRCPAIAWSKKQAELLSVPCNSKKFRTKTLLEFL